MIKVEKRKEGGTIINNFEMTRPATTIITLDKLSTITDCKQYLLLWFLHKAIKIAVYS